MLTHKISGYVSCKSVSVSSCMKFAIQSRFKSQNNNLVIIYLWHLSDL